MGHCMVGNWMGNSMMGNGVGHGMVGNSMVGNWMGDGVSQETNTMVSWRMVDSGSHSMVGSVVNRWGSMVHNWGSMVHKWCSMVNHWGSMVHNRGSMVNHWGFVNRSLIIDCLSSVSHFLDHPISTIVVSHS